MSLHFFYLTNQRMCIPTFGLKGYLREKGLAISCGTVDRLNLLYHINCWDLSQGVLWAETNPWRLQLKPSGFHLDISPTPKNTSKYTWARGVEFTLLGGSASIYSLTDLCTVKTPAQSASLHSFFSECVSLCKSAFLLTCLPNCLTVSLPWIVQE